MDLTGRAILVTGASSGLGRETAILASRLGARVLLLGRDRQRLRQTFESLEGQGHDSVSFDLNETDKIPELLAAQAIAFAVLRDCSLGGRDPIEAVARVPLGRFRERLPRQRGGGGAVAARFDETRRSRPCRLCRRSDRLDHERSRRHWAGRVCGVEGRRLRFNARRRVSNWPASGFASTPCCPAASSRKCWSKAKPICCPSTCKQS